MDFQQNVALNQYSTMGLGGVANYLVEITSKEELQQASSWAKQNNLPAIMIGSGSNIVWSDEGYPGIVLVNRIKGFSIASEDEIGTYINIGGGEIWDSVVENSTKLGLTGIECLSLIPGTAGATPVQNVGAYGQDISQTLVTLTALDTTTNLMTTIRASDCGFGYRTSIFKTSPGKYLISDITLLLRKGHIMPPFYPALENYLNQHSITDYSPSVIRQAVADIRTHKLPDPTKVANCGSFFANPKVNRSVLDSIHNEYPDVPNWASDNDTFKLSAAWLIDKAGFANYYDQESGMATWPGQPLIFTNKNARSTADLLSFTSKVQSKVKAMFGVDLAWEPRLIA